MTLPVVSDEYHGLRMHVTFTNELEGNEKNSFSKNTCMQAECETINRNLNGHNFTVNGCFLHERLVDSSLVGASKASSYLYHSRLREVSS